ncbi:MAG: intradiol ring-cleavage dioxygenase [Phycisphaera sp.]|nr:intradiol ring-cleavage dioxygenase [Phycisphaera sp.]
MSDRIMDPFRRRIIHGMALGAAALWTPGVFAEELVLTPKQTEGPFYPTKLPLDTDNDLLIVNDKITPAVGTVTHLTGKVFDAKGSPVRNALVEIWQVDHNGIYLHPKEPKLADRDANFQSYGRFLTGSSGEYYFRTIQPVPYGDGRVQRTAHIHFAINRADKRLLTTQCYIKGHPANAKDMILNGIRDAKQKASVLVDFQPIKESKIGEVAGRFDIVLGWTPEA